MPYATKQQQAVLHCLEQRPRDALTAVELAADLRGSGQRVGLATVYRQLERLEAAGRVHRVQTGEGAFYQLCPHPHSGRPCFLLRCRDCGRVEHLDCSRLEALTRHLEEAHRFRLDPRSTLLSGQCGECARKEDGHGAQ